jgi:lipoprotein-anchoring transpeptidase ErfK/SrfK
VPVAVASRSVSLARGTWVALAAVAFAVSACTPPASPASPSTSGASAAGSPSPTSSPSPTEPTVTVDGAATAVSYLNPVRLVVADGSFASVQVSVVGDTATALEGSVSGDGLSWLSELAPKPAASYSVVATVKDPGGAVTSTTTSFTVAAVPDDQKVSFTVSPKDGTTVGIGQPIVVRFLTPIAQRAAIEKVMLVDAENPSGGAVTGSWSWLNNQEVHWRPQEFWAPGTKVILDMKIAGVQAGPNRYGRKDYRQAFTIGASHVTKVDASTYRTKVYRDGALVATWQSGTGKRGLETYSGTYVVLGKAKVVQMDSCSARITCDKKNPDYYDEKEYWATRVTASGTFLHAAGWDGLLGRANVSHGCVHLSDKDAEEFYNHAVVGDVVIVSNSGRGPQERIATQDPGLYDWNLSWSKWTAGSALT